MLYEKKEIYNTGINCAVVIVLAFKYSLFIGYVPSESMEPTLKAGSYIIGSRIYGELKTGDIIIFEHDEKMLVKRIAATEGERITENGLLILFPKAVILSSATIGIIHNRFTILGRTVYHIE